MAEQARTAWRFFPWCVALGLSVVAAVNAGMVWAALGTHPGKAGGDGFGLSNRYDRVLDESARQAALGWTLAARVDADGIAEIAATGLPGGAAAAARAEATRPVGGPAGVPLALRSVGAGIWRAETPLPGKGQWDLDIVVTAGSGSVAATRRVIAR